MRRALTFFALLIASIAAHADGALSPSAIASTASSHIDAGLPMADSVLVRKGERKLYLLRDGQVLRTYKIALGLQPEGHKVVEGDFRTPEGKYLLNRRNPNSEYFLSIQISYPNEQDVARARKLGTSFARVGWTGGQGGTPQEVYCAPGEAVTGLGLAHTRGRGLKREYVNSVDLLCQQRQRAERCISSGEGCGPLSSVTRGTIVQTVHDYQYDRLLCPPNEMATGIQGRSGAFVDAIGLICGPLPPPPPPNSQWMGKSKPTQPSDPGYSVGNVGRDAPTLKKAPAPMAIERPKRDLMIK